jgi:hypothetical protein
MAERPRWAAAASAHQAWMPIERGRGRGRGGRGGPLDDEPPPQEEVPQEEQPGLAQGQAHIPPIPPIELLRAIMLNQGVAQGANMPPPPALAGNQPQPGVQPGAVAQAAQAGQHIPPPGNMHGIDADFVALLRNFQFSQLAIDAIIANGVTSTQSLIGLTPKDIKNIMTIMPNLYHL